MRSRVNDVKRLNNSYAGNPRYRLLLAESGSWFDVKKDASFQYEVTNQMIGRTYQFSFEGNKITDAKEIQ